MKTIKISDLNSNNYCVKCNRKMGWVKIVSIGTEDGLQDMEIKTICSICNKQKKDNLVKQSDT